MHGKAEHQGNRDYYGSDNIAAARNREIFKRLARIANIRKQSVALQRGLQENVAFDGHKAAFYRVYQREGIHQTALVLLNKGDQAAGFTIDQFVSAGSKKRGRYLFCANAVIFVHASNRTHGFRGDSSPHNAAGKPARRCVLRRRGPLRLSGAVVRLLRAS